MACFSYKAAYKSVYDFNGEIVDYYPAILSNEKYSESRNQLMGQAMSHLDSLSPNEINISNLTLKLIFNTDNKRNTIFSILVRNFIRKSGKKILKHKMESNLEKTLNLSTKKRIDDYTLIKPKEWLPCSIGVYLNWRRWENYETEHPHIKTQRLNSIEVGTLFLFNTYQVATTAGALIGIMKLISIAKSAF